MHTILLKIFYKLTAYYPRRLPQTEFELNKTKEIMVKYLGLELGDGVWYTVLSQMTAGKPTSLRRSYALMVNAAKKLKISKLAQDHKTIEHQAYLDKLKETALRVASELQKEPDQSEHSEHQDWVHPIGPADVQELTHNLQGDVPGL